RQWGLRDSGFCFREIASGVPQFPKKFSRKDAKIAKAQRRVKCIGRAFASLRSLRLCVKSSSVSLFLQDRCGIIRHCSAARRIEDVAVACTNGEVWLARAHSNLAPLARLRR